MSADTFFIHRAVELALAAEREGNLPIGAVIVLDDKVIAESGNRTFVPHFHPGRHAETSALALIDEGLWSRRAEMTCYSTLEPCLMCTGALVLHQVGRVVFGARDVKGGAASVLAHLPPYYRVPEWIGPALPELCDPLYARTRERFECVHRLEV
ncbi:MAG: nucleoside deaminase [Betaproteobacteria bacterium]|nr:nucleoside deaminase [Betaproteobacteria bacterium]